MTGVMKLLDRVRAYWHRSSTDTDTGADVYLLLDGERVLGPFEGRFYLDKGLVIRHRPVVFFNGPEWQEVDAMEAVFPERSFVIPMPSTVVAGGHRVMISGARIEVTVP